MLLFVTVDKPLPDPLDTSKETLDRPGTSNEDPPASYSQPLQTGMLIRNACLASDCDVKIEILIDCGSSDRRFPDEIVCNFTWS